jgi:hypothetical protein
MLAMTTVTRRILRQAQQRGFRVRTSLAGGRVIHYLDQHGQDGSFGAVYVGQRTGRITGAVLHQGNAGRGRHPLPRRAGHRPSDPRDSREASGFRRLEHAHP